MIETKAAQDIQVVADSRAEEEAEGLVVVAEDVERSERLEPAGLAKRDHLQLVRAEMPPPGQQPHWRLKRRGVRCSPPQLEPVRGGRGERIRCRQDGGIHSSLVTYLQV